MRNVSMKAFCPQMAFDKALQYKNISHNETKHGL